EREVPFLGESEFRKHHAIPRGSSDRRADAYGPRIEGFDSDVRGVRTGALGRSLTVAALILTGDGQMPAARGRWSARLAAMRSISCWRRFRRSGIGRSAFPSRSSER